MNDFQPKMGDRNTLDLLIQLRGGLPECCDFFWQPYRPDSLMGCNVLCARLQPRPERGNHRNVLLPILRPRLCSSRHLQEAVMTPSDYAANVATRFPDACKGKVLVLTKLAAIEVSAMYSRRNTEPRADHVKALQAATLNVQRRAAITLASRARAIIGQGRRDEVLAAVVQPTKASALAKRLGMNGGYITKVLNRFLVEGRVTRNMVGNTSVSWRLQRAPQPKPLAAPARPCHHPQARPRLILEQR